MSPRPRISLCAFSCHQQWHAVEAGHAGTRFKDAPGFFDYARSLGAEGVQVALRSLEQAHAMRAKVEATSGWYEGDIRLPKNESDLAAFDDQVRWVHEAGGTVARSVLTGQRRYEGFHSMEEFRAFRAHGEQSLWLAEPVLKKHRVRLALENHKDQVIPEMLEMLHHISSEWVGVCVDTGNNIALLEEPHAVVEALAPFAASVHFKDMAVQPFADGFLLSEVPPGTGFLDLPRIVATLRKANSAIGFNLEMATRDPLKVPCLAPGYWATFPDRPAIDLARAMGLAKQYAVSHQVPQVAGKAVEVVLAEEEANNRTSLQWMREHVS